MACRGEQAVIEKAQCRRPILSSASPQQRRIPVDEIAPPRSLLGQREHPAGLALAFNATRSISINSGSSMRAAVSSPSPVLPVLSG
jgi:hypothetical protein